MDSLRCQDPPRPLLAEQELHLHRGRAGHRGGEADPRRPGVEDVPGGCARGALRQPHGDARARPPAHVHRQPDGGVPLAPRRALGGQGRSVDEEVPGPPRALQARDALPLQLPRHVHALGDRAKGHRRERAGLPAPPALRPAGLREPHRGGQPRGNLGRRLGFAGAHGGDRALRAALSPTRDVEGAAARARGLGRRSDGPSATGTRVTAISSGARATIPIGETVRSASTAS